MYESSDLTFKSHLTVYELIALDFEVRSIKNDQTQCDWSLVMPVLSQDIRFLSLSSYVMFPLVRQLCPVFCLLSSHSSFFFLEKEILKKKKNSAFVSSAVDPADTNQADSEWLSLVCLGVLGIAGLSVLLSLR